jgi:tryptophan-rich sensory protein
MNIHWIRLLASLFICNAAGFIGAAFTSTGVDSWYASLVKPALNPPNWIFGPVWTFLYICMGIALYIVWNKGYMKGFVLFAFAGQLLLNTAWSLVFFGLEDVVLAFVTIVVLWIFILLTIVYFSTISKAATWLLVPYLAWVTFAAYLNYEIMFLN